MSVLADLLRGVSQASNQLPQAMQQRLMNRQRQEQLDYDREREKRLAQLDLQKKPLEDKLARLDKFEEILLSKPIDPDAPNAVEVEKQNQQLMADLQKEREQTMADLRALYAPQGPPEAAPTGAPSPTLPPPTLPTSEPEWAAPVPMAPPLSLAQRLAGRQKQQPSPKETKVDYGSNWDFDFDQGVMTRTGPKGEPVLDLIPESFMTNGWSSWSYAPQNPSTIWRQNKKSGKTEWLTVPVEFQNQEKAVERTIALAKDKAGVFRYIDEQIRAGKAGGVSWALRRAQQDLAHWGKAIDQKLLEEEVKDTVAEAGLNPQFNSTEREQLRFTRLCQVQADKIITLLNDPEVAQNVGLISGGVEKLQARLTGRANLADKLGELNTRAMNLMDIIVRERSGAAISEEEQKFYARLLGDLSTDPEALKRSLYTLMDIMSEHREELWRQGLIGIPGMNEVDDDLLRQIPRYRPENVEDGPKYLD